MILYTIGFLAAVVLLVVFAERTKAGEKVFQKIIDSMEE